MKYKIGDKVIVRLSDTNIKNGIVKNVSTNDTSYIVEVEQHLHGIDEQYLSISNRRWLESLSDEQLANYLDDINESIDGKCAIETLANDCSTYCKDAVVSDISCRECVKKWLQAEHKE